MLYAIRILFVFIACVRMSYSMNILIIGESSTQYLFKAAQLGIGSQLNATYTTVFTDQGNFLQSVCNLTSTQIDGILDLSAYMIGSDDMAKYLNSLLVTMKSWDQFSQYEISNIPSVGPSANSYMQSVVTFLNTVGTTIDSVLIIFSQNFDQSLLFPSLTSTNFIPVYMKEANYSNAQDVMSFIKQVAVSEIILASEFALAQIVIRTAIQNQMLNGVYHWYLLTKDLSTFSCPNCGNGTFLMFQKVVVNTNLFNNIMGFNSSLQSTPNAIDLVNAYQVGQTMGILYNMAVVNQKWSSSPSYFSCWNSSANNNITWNNYNLGLQLLPTISFNGVLEPVIFNGTEQNQYSSIMISQVSVGNSPSVVSSVLWTSFNGLGNNNMSTYLISQKVLKVLVIREPPFVDYVNGSYVGYSVDVLQSLANAMNFNYTIFEQIDGIYGSALGNGTFIGLIGQMAVKNYDLAIGAITITSDREMVVDFSIPYYDYVGIQILFQNVPTSTVGDQAFFLKAFTWDVWATVIATIIGTGILITIVDRVSPFSFQNRLKADEIHEGEADGKIFTLKESMWFVLGAYTQAGESFDPRSISCRVIVVGFWLFSYLMMAMYTANLAAQLTVAKLANIPNSYQAFAAQSSIPYTTQTNTSMYDYFYRMMMAEVDIFNYWTQKGISNLNNPQQSAMMSTWEYPVNEIYTNMFQSMANWGFSTDTASSISLVKNNQTAVFMETAIINYYTNRDCSLVAIGDPFSLRPYGIVLQKNSPLLNQLNLQILILQQNRILEQLKDKWWSSGSVTCDSGSTSAGLGLDTLGGAFIFLAVGIGIAGLIFIGEKIVAHIWGTEWAKLAATDPTVVRPMGMMSTLNLGSHISIRRRSHASGLEVGKSNPSIEHHGHGHGHHHHEHGRGHEHGHDHGHSRSQQTDIERNDHDTNNGCGNPAYEGDNIKM